MKGDLAETENSLAGDEASTEEQIVAEEISSTIDEEDFVAVRQHGWMCPRIHGNAVVFSSDLFDVVSSYRHRSWRTHRSTTQTS